MQNSRPKSIDKKEEIPSSEVIQQYVRAEGDNSCAFNSFLIGLQAVILSGALDGKGGEEKDKPENKYKKFIDFLNNEYKQSIPGLNRPVSWNSFKKFIETADIYHLQKSLAQPFRLFSSQLIKEDSVSHRVHKEATSITLESNFRQYILNRLQEEKFFSDLKKNIAAGLYDAEAKRGGFNDIVKSWDEFKQFIATVPSAAALKGEVDGKENENFKKPELYRLLKYKFGFEEQKQEVKDDTHKFAFIKDEFKKHIEHFTHLAEDYPSNKTQIDEIILSKGVGTKLQEWWNVDKKNQPSGHNQFISAMCNPNEWAGDLELAPLGRFWGVNLDMHSQVISQYSIYAYYGSFAPTDLDQKLITPDLIKLLKDRNIIDRTRIDDGNREEYPWVKLDEKTLNERMRKIEINLEDMDGIQKGKPILNYVSPNDIPELVRRGVIVFRGDQYVFDMSLDVVIERTDAIGTPAQIAKILQHWQNTYRDPPTIQFYKWPAHWDSIIEMPVVDKVLFELLQIPGVVEIKEHIPRLLSPSQFKQFVQRNPSIQQLRKNLESLSNLSSYLNLGKNIEKQNELLVRLYAREKARSIIKISAERDKKEYDEKITEFKQLTQKFQTLAAQRKEIKDEKSEQDVVVAVAKFYETQYPIIEFLSEVYKKIPRPPFVLESQIQDWSNYVLSRRELGKFHNQAMTFQPVPVTQTPTPDGSTSTTPPSAQTAAEIKKSAPENVSAELERKQPVKQSQESAEQKASAKRKDEILGELNKLIKEIDEDKTLTTKQKTDLIETLKILIVITNVKEEENVPPIINGRNIYDIEDNRNFKSKKWSWLTQSIITTVKLARSAKRLTDLAHKLDPSSGTCFIGCIASAIAFGDNLDIYTDFQNFNEVLKASYGNVTRQIQEDAKSDSESIYFKVIADIIKHHLGKRIEFKNKVELLSQKHFHEIHTSLIVSDQPDDDFLNCYEEFTTEVEYFTYFDFLLTYHQTLVKEHVNTLMDEEIFAKANLLTLAFEWKFSFQKIQFLIENLNQKHFRNFFTKDLFAHEKYLSNLTPDQQKIFYQLLLTKLGSERSTGINDALLRLAVILKQKKDEPVAQESGQRAQAPGAGRIKTEDRQKNIDYVDNRPPPAAPMPEVPKKEQKRQVEQSIEDKKVKHAERKPAESVYTDVNLEEYPRRDAKHLPDPSNQLTIGDMHGNALKLVYFLIRQGILDLKHGEKDYQQLVDIYKSIDQPISKADFDKFNHILEKAQWHTNAGTIRLIGDLLADRGQNDYFILKIIEQLHNHDVPFEVIFSNHDHEFFRILQSCNGDLTQISEQDWPGVFGQQYGMQNAQDYSTHNLVEMLKQSEFKDLKLNPFIEIYKQHTKLISYTVDEDKSPPEITLFTHAPVDLTQIQAAAKIFNIPYQDDNIPNLCATIDKINQRFQHEFHTNINQFMDRFTDESLQDNPFFCFIWNRGSENRGIKKDSFGNIVGISVNLPTVSEKPYLIRLAHGHDKVKLGSQYINLDNDLGKQGIVLQHKHKGALTFHYSQQASQVKATVALSDQAQEQKRPASQTQPSQETKPKSPAENKVPNQATRQEERKKLATAEAKVKEEEIRAEEKAKEQAREEELKKREEAREKQRVENEKKQAEENAKKLQAALLAKENELKTAMAESKRLADEKKAQETKAAIDKIARFDNEQKAKQEKEKADAEAAEASKVAAAAEKEARRAIEEAEVKRTAAEAQAKGAKGDVLSASAPPAVDDVPLKSPEEVEAERAAEIAQQQADRARLAAEAKLEADRKAEAANKKAEEAKRQAEEARQQEKTLKEENEKEIAKQQALEEETKKTKELQIANEKKLADLQKKQKAEKIALEDKMEEMALRRLIDDKLLARKQVRAETSLSSLSKESKENNYVSLKLIMDTLNLVSLHAIDKSIKNKLKKLIKEIMARCDDQQKAFVEKEMEKLIEDKEEDFKLPTSVKDSEQEKEGKADLSNTRPGYSSIMKTQQTKVFHIEEGDSKGCTLLTERKPESLEMTVEIPPTLAKIKFTSTDSNDLTKRASEAYLELACKAILTFINVPDKPIGTEDNKIIIQSDPDTEEGRNKIKAFILVCEAKGLKYTRGFDDKHALWQYHPSEEDKDFLRKQPYFKSVDLPADEERALEARLKALESHLDAGSKEVGEVREVISDACEGRISFETIVPILVEKLRDFETPEPAISPFP